MPTSDALQQMKDDLKYKEQQLENSQTTAEKLREELQYRQVYVPFSVAEKFYLYGPSRNLKK